MALRYHYFNYIIIQEQILPHNADYSLLLPTLISTFLGQINP